MKYSWVCTVLMVGCLSVFGEVSKGQLKDFKRLVSIDSIRDYEGQSRGSETHILKVEFSSEEEGLEDIRIRIAVEMTDKKAKQAYLAEGMSGFGELPEDYQGEGYWEFTMPSGDFDKLKMTAYVVEVGVMDGDAFVPFHTECDHAETFAELTGRTAQKFPGSCTLRATVLVDD